MDRFLEQVAIEASQMYVTEDGKSPFANTVRFRNHLWNVEVDDINFYGTSVEFVKFRKIPRFLTNFELENFSFLDH